MGFLLSIIATCVVLGASIVLVTAFLVSILVSVVLIGVVSDAAVHQFFRTLAGVALAAVAIGVGFLVYFGDQMLTVWSYAN